jgi:hypothetical protein
MGFHPDHQVCALCMFSHGYNCPGAVVQLAGEHFHRVQCEAAAETTEEVGSSQGILETA